jgi:hypothetical protein
VLTRNESRSHVVSSIPLVRSLFPPPFDAYDVSWPGSYTFAKTLEYKAKHGLNAGKEVTVMPPAEYQDRFVSALDGYFLACPGTLPMFRVF